MALALKTMPFHHVIAKVGPSDRFQCLFSDLSETELRRKFITPFERGRSFFAGNELVYPADLKSIHIVSTERSDQVERDEINRVDRERIGQINRTSEHVFFVSPGGGYEPEDILAVGKDLTHTYIKGPPGYRAGVKAIPLKVVGWVGGIVAAVIAAGIAKWLGWV